VGTAIIVSFVAAAAFAGLMHHSETTISLPAAGEKVALQRLVYKSRRFQASVTSVSLERKSEEGADPVLADWVFTASNTDGQIHRVEMQIRLLDESGKQVGWSVAKHPVRAAASGETFVVPMKVKADVWGATKKVRIFADWIT
jgi:hypothetical protein